MYPGFVNICELYIFYKTHVLLRRAVLEKIDNVWFELYMKCRLYI